MLADEPVKTEQPSQAASPEPQPAPAETPDSSVVLRNDGSVAAQEILQTISSLMNTLNTERQVVLVAEEGRREAMIEVARLQGELEVERRLREKAEAELQRLRDEQAERRKRAQAELARLRSNGDAQESPSSEGPRFSRMDRDTQRTGSEHAPELRERSVEEEGTGRRHAEAEAELARFEEGARQRLEWAREALDRRGGHGASEQFRPEAKEATERALGQKPQEEPGSRHSQPRPVPAAAGPLSPLTTPEAGTFAPGSSAPELGPSPARSEEEQAEPLPPGWRYASDAPTEQGRKRWPFFWRSR